MAAALLLVAALYYATTPVPANPFSAHLMPGQPIPPEARCYIYYEAPYWYTPSCVVEVEGFERVTIYGWNGVIRVTIFIPGKASVIQVGDLMTWFGDWRRRWGRYITVYEWQGLSAWVQRPSRARLLDAVYSVRFVQ